MRHAVEHGKGQQRHRRAEIGVDPVEQEPQGGGDDHRGTDEVEHAEPDDLRRHGEKGDGGDQEAREVDDDTAPEGVLRKVQGDTGEQNKAHADKTLPDHHAGMGVPNAVVAVDHENIVAEVEGDHIQQPEAAQGVDETETVRKILFHIN